MVLAAGPTTPDVVEDGVVIQILAAFLHNPVPLTAVGGMMDK